MLRKIVIGSRAAQRHIKDFRSGSDMDVWSSVPIPDCDNAVMPPEILEAFEDVSKHSGYASLNDLFTIKMSHLSYDIFWHKHLQDMLVFKKHGATYNKPLYALLQNYWRCFHKNKPYLSLYRTKDAFFDDFVKKDFDHDYLHELVAYPNKPVYSHCLKDGEQVAIDREKFNALPFEQQIKMFREEINVIACERWLIPTREQGTITFSKAYTMSLHKTVTALTKGWASYFICENIEHFLYPNRADVVNLFKTVGIKV